MRSFISAFCWLGLAAAALLVYFFATVPDLPQVPEPLSRIIETPPTEVYAATGERIMVIGGREAVPLGRVSPLFIEAVIATEDHRFRAHHGFDKLRTLKALWVTLFQRGKVQGASTITQQLAKNLFFSFDRTYLRKFRELLVAFQIEARYSKQEILEAYVNQIAFGVGAHGIEQAARVFFGKPAVQLDLPEAALLAGLPKSPTRYNPLRYFERAKGRQKVVLDRMVKVGAITAAEAERAYQAKLSLREPGGAEPTGSYFLDAVLKDLEERYGSDVVHHGGLKVFTTLEPQLQGWAAEAVRGGLERLDQLLGVPGAVGGSSAARPQGALVAVDAHSGAVRAMVGGRDYAETEYNRAVQNNRLPGSGFKPFVYYAAFETLKLNPASVMVDRKGRDPGPGAAGLESPQFQQPVRGPDDSQTRPGPERQLDRGPARRTRRPQGGHRRGPPLRHPKPARPGALGRPGNLGRQPPGAGFGVCHPGRRRHSARTFLDPPRRGRLRPGPGGADHQRSAGAGRRDRLSGGRHDAGRSSTRARAPRSGGWGFRCRPPAKPAPPTSSTMPGSPVSPPP